MPLQPQINSTSPTTPSVKAIKQQPSNGHFASNTSSAASSLRQTPSPSKQLAPRPNQLPPGLEPLLSLNHVFVKQEIEIAEMFVNVETANRYNIINGLGQRIYFASEVSGIGLCMGGSSRPFTINIVDYLGRAALILDRPYEMCAGAVMDVNLGSGAKLGRIIQAGVCTAQFDIMDAFDKLIMQISGPQGGDCCTGEADYEVHTTAGDRLGMIRKTFAGFIQESFTDADNFGVSFPPDLDVKWKALMLAAVFLIDFLYFEKAPHRRRNIGHGPIGRRIGTGHGLLNNDSGHHSLLHSNLHDHSLLHSHVHDHSLLHSHSHSHSHFH